MANSELRYLVYTGLGLGREPATEFGDGRGVKWNTHDRKVRALPADKAAQILQQHPADFKEALLRLSQYAFSMGRSPASESTEVSLCHRAPGCELR